MENLKTKGSVALPIIVAIVAIAVVCLVFWYGVPKESEMTPKDFILNFIGNGQTEDNIENLDTGDNMDALMNETEGDGNNTEVVPKDGDGEDGGSDTEGVFCTADARACPDGSFVGRVPPDCSFAPCPGQ